SPRYRSSKTPAALRGRFAFLHLVEGFPAVQRHDLEGLAVSDGPGIDRPFGAGLLLDKNRRRMGRPSVDHIAARFRLIDIVVVKQLELIEHQQQARGVTAGIDAIELAYI